MEVFLAKQQCKSHVVPGIDAPVFAHDGRSTFPKNMDMAVLYPRGACWIVGFRFQGS